MVAERHPDLIKSKVMLTLFVIGCVLKVVYKRYRSVIIPYIGRIILGPWLYKTIIERNDFNEYVRYGRSGNKSTTSEDSGIFEDME
jgi:hypothetical protein